VDGTVAGLCALVAPAGLLAEVLVAKLEFYLVELPAGVLADVPAEPPAEDLLEGLVEKVPGELPAGRHGVLAVVLLEKRPVELPAGKPGGFAELLLEELQLQRLEHLVVLC
jgi:hypothetical protein